MKILGIDPGFERLGIAILKKNKGDQKEAVLHSECFKTSSKLEFSERLHLIGEKIRTVVEEHNPDVLAIETLFLTTNHKTVMHVAEARGVVLYEAMRGGLRLFEASPPQIKVAVAGHGGADKQQVMKMVRMLVHIPAGKDSDDELDAIAIALTAFAHLKA